MKPAKEDYWCGLKSNVVVLSGAMVSALAIGPKIHGFRPGWQWQKSTVRLPLEGK